ncbi:MAG: hypothetical protein GY948_11915 [Alphaproteobacteria bacterium]|nr:hypothetical protein [Alphaproteobacteria bacterium]
MPRFMLFSALLAGLICFSFSSPPAQAGDQRTWSNVNNGSPPRYTKDWRKRAKRRYYRKRRGRTYRRHRESRDYLVTFPHSRVHLGTNM